MKHVTDLRSSHFKLALRQHEDKGICVFAGQAASKGAVLMSTVAIPIAETNLGTSYHRFIFYRRSDNEVDKTAGYLVFDFLSWCSHSGDPNLELAWREDDDLVLVDVVARRHIEPGDELTMTYSNVEDYPDSDKWKDSEC